MFLILFFVFLTCLFLTYTLYLFTSRASDKKRALLKERLADAIRTSAHSTDMDVFPAQWDPKLGIHVT